MTPTGQVTEFPPIPVLAEAFAESNGILAGPGGALWFDDTVVHFGSPHQSQSFIGRMTTDGAVTLFPVSPAPSRLPATGVTVVAGADGNLWFVEDEGKSSVFGRMSPSGAVAQLPVSRMFASYLELGPDGSLIVTGRRSARKGPTELFEVSTSGALTPVRVPRAIRYASLTYLGPADGSLWFTNALIAQVSKIGRLTASGVATSYDLPGRGRQQGVGSMTVGADGDLYVLKNVYRGLINNFEMVYRITPGELPPPRTGHGSHA
jgi:streptogramin lyase